MIAAPTKFALNVARQVAASTVYLYQLRRKLYTAEACVHAVRTAYLLQNLLCLQLAPTA